jgi:hypothetical protein
MFRKYIQKICEKTLEKYFQEKTVISVPEKYQPLQKIRGALYCWVQVPFNKTNIWCELRVPNGGEVIAAGNYSNIDNKKTPEKLNISRMIEMRNYQERLATSVLNKPKFSEILAMVNLDDNVLKEHRKRLEEIKAIDISGLPAKERSDLNRRKLETELLCGFALPNDTYGFLANWANGNDVSDIKKISDEKYLEAAILAKNGGDNPSDHLDGFILTEGNREDINRYCWHVYSEYLEQKMLEHKTERKSAFPKRRR